MFGRHFRAKNEYVPRISARVKGDVSEIFPMDFRGKNENNPAND